ncbi:ribosome biogenesis GTPase Der [Rhodovibrionaceae bacterium A322]
MSALTEPAFTLAIIGRPNVGKSTLFNRFVGKRLALVDDQPGVTRDRREGDGRLFDLRFRVMDTAGLEDATDDTLEGRMRLQTERAIEEADVVLFLMDARAGVNPLDSYFARLLRKSKKPVILCANKAETQAAEMGLGEAYKLGFGEPVGISGEHGLGLSDLRDAIFDKVDVKVEAAERRQEEAEAEREAARQAALEAREARLAAGEEIDEEEDDLLLEERPSGPLQLVVVGRPNVGKSTFINYLLGEDRLLVGPEAGITRDSISVEWSYKDQPIKLFDTAGLRRRSKVDDKVEWLSANDTKRAVDYAHVVVLMLDANLGMEKQDLTIARRVVDEGRALIIAMNKWDVAENRAMALRQVEDRLERSFPQTRGIPIVTLSALEGRGANKVLDAVFEVYETWNKRFSTSVLNRWLEDATAAHPPPAPGGRRIRLKYITQARTRPPTFAISCSNLEHLPDSYLRYLENALREDFDLPGIPIRIHLKKSANPYANRKKR